MILVLKYIVFFVFYYFFSKRIFYPIFILFLLVFFVNNIKHTFVIYYSSGLNSEENLPFKINTFHRKSLNLKISKKQIEKLCASYPQRKKLVFRSLCILKIALFPPLFFENQKTEA